MNYSVCVTPKGLKMTNNSQCPGAPIKKKIVVARR